MARSGCYASAYTPLAASDLVRVMPLQPENTRRKQRETIKRQLNMVHHTRASLVVPQPLGPTPLACLPPSKFKRQILSQEIHALLPQFRAWTMDIVLRDSGLRETGLAPENQGSIGPSPDG